MHPTSTQGSFDPLAVTYILIGTSCMLLTKTPMLEGRHSSGIPQLRSLAEGGQARHPPAHGSHEMPVQDLGAREQKGFAEVSHGEL